MTNHPKNIVLIPSSGYRGDKFLTYSTRGVGAVPGRSWERLEGEGLEPGREMTSDGLATNLRLGVWRILPRNHPNR